MIKRVKMSFRYRFILVFVTIEAFFIVLIVGMNFVTIEKASQKAVEQKIETTHTLMAKLIKSPLSVYDLATLDNILENLEYVQDVLYVIIADSSDRILSTNYQGQLLTLEEVNAINENQFMQIKGRDIAFTYGDIYNGDVKIGHMHIGFDITHSLELIRENRKNTYSIILIEILISAIFAFFLGHKLTSKLLQLTEAASNIGKDIQTKIPHFEINDELGVLAKAMDTMQNEIMERNGELKLFKQLFEATTDGIIITNEKGLIELYNASFLSMTGYQGDELIGRNVNILSSGLHGETFYKNLWDSVIKMGSWRGEIINRKKNGDLYTILLNINSIKNDKNEIVNYVGISSDITELKEKEKILKIQGKMATIGEMLGNIAHQWRQPLSAISTAASGMKLQKDNDLLDDTSFDTSLNLIMHSTESLSKTIEDFKNFFKHEKETSTFYISTILKEAIVLLDSSFKKENIEVIVDIKDDVELTSYKNDFMQAVINVLKNSKDAFERVSHKPVIILRVKLSGMFLSIDVIDNAGGIEEEILGKIFEPYFTTKHQAQGTGIGLYMTHMIIVDHMNGRIKVKNCDIDYKGEKYQGLNFQIFLPYKA